MEAMTMKKAILGWLAAAMLLPATSFAHDFFPGRRDARYEPVYRERPWDETNRRGYWHLHRVPRRHGPGYENLYHWHPADRFDRFDYGRDRPWFGFER
jgi:hypothetical protein